jgi:two-component sensor histidine kinase
MPIKDNPGMRRTRPTLPRSGKSASAVLVRQLRSLAQFGEQALKLDDLEFLLGESCRLVGEALGTDLAKIIVLDEDGKSIFVRAGVGWQPGVVGELRVPLSQDSADRFALRKREPVVVANVPHQRRFTIANFVIEAGVKAFVNVPIIGAEEAGQFGILEVDSTVDRRFTQDDVAFLKTYANMIAAAVERQKSNETLRKLADQRQLLLIELQHRLKNNLQSVSAFVSMALRDPGAEAGRSALDSLLGRIETLKLVQEKIYASGAFDSVDLASYLGELSAALLRFHKNDRNRIGLKSDLIPIAAAVDTAVPLGLIVTEFITNSMKYAFDGDGSVSIELKAEDVQGLLILADDGKGLGESQSDGTGMKVIRGLARQLNAKLEWSGHPGTTLSVRFPLHAA